MSASPTAPADIVDTRLPINPKYVEYDRRANKVYPIADFMYCVACQWQSSPTANKCERCGRLVLTYIEKNDPFNLGPDGVSAHLRRKVTNCMNASRDNTGQVVSHPLAEGIRDVVDLNTQEFHRETYCKTCEFVYTFSEGRLATEEELEKARMGKIRAPERRKLIGKGSGA